MIIQSTGSRTAKPILIKLSEADQQELQRLAKAHKLAPTAYAYWLLRQGMAHAAMLVPQGETAKEHANQSTREASQ